jgi:thiol-disulfide isomerase/thioredoxin
VSFASRIGLALVAPRWALAVANDRRNAGRSGSDLIIILLVATQLPALVQAVWEAEDSFGQAGQDVVDTLTRALVLDLAFLVLGALLLWTLAGARRNLGRAFDLACVAALPMLFVDIAVTLVVRTADLELPPIARIVLSMVSWAWTGALLALAIAPARTAPSKSYTVPGELALRGRRAGTGVLAVAALATAIAIGWCVMHPDELRPVMRGTPAPAFALPTIVDAHGTLGPRRSLADARGKIVIVDFWASWCGYCLSEMPHLAQIARQPDVEVFAVDLAHQDDPGTAFAVFAERGYAQAMTLVADDGTTSTRYNVGRIPHTVVIDPDGQVRTVWRGTGIDLAKLVKEIRKPL